MGLTQQLDTIKNLHIEDVVLALHGEILPGTVSKLYEQKRKVCGLVAVKNGQCEYNFNDGTVRLLKAGQIALFSSESAYVFKNITNESFDHYTVNFILKEEETLPFSYIIIMPENTADYFELCDNMLSDWTSGEMTSMIRCRARINEAVAMFFESALGTEKRNDNYTKVLPAIRYLNKRYNRKITIFDLSKICMMSETNFRRVFKYICGKSPVEYLTDIRVKRALELVQHSGMTVSQIALHCGFRDEGYFCRIFKREIGKTVSEVRGFSLSMK